MKCLLFGIRQEICTASVLRLQGLVAGGQSAASNKRIAGELYLAVLAALVAHVLHDLGVLLVVGQLILSHRLQQTAQPQQAVSAQGSLSMLELPGAGVTPSAPSDCTAAHRHELKLQLPVTAGLPAVQNEWRSWKLLSTNWSVLRRWQPEILVRLVALFRSDGDMHFLEGT
jgi:hypothetical protein